jgi:LmbE family N-acetylglucosaminyl deacetylase
MEQEDMDEKEEETIMNQRILVVASHPDDEVLGCGGTIARLAREGHAVHIAILGEGITSRYARRGQVDKKVLRKLHDRSHRVAKLLGAKDLFMGGLPDNRFDTVPLLDVVKIIEDLVQRIRPEVVYTQHGGDLNIDHVITFRATLTATRPMNGCLVKALYAYEVASSTEWAFQQFSPVFHPDTFVDIGTTLECKVAAMQAYESESRAFPHPRSPEALRTQARRWGATAGLDAAEAFQSVRIIQ